MIDLKIFIVIVQLLLLFQLCPVWADDSDDSDGENVTMIDDHNEEELKTVTSMEAFNETGQHTAGSLRMAAEYASRSGDFEKAITLCERALDRDFNDIDIHKTYAEALEEKLRTEKENDHLLLNKCVREWLIIYRTEVGDERGTSFHGIDPLGYLYRDEDRSMMARTHLITLAGRTPKIWETDEKYMKWVNRPTTEVAGQILKSTDKK